MSPRAVREYLDALRPRYGLAKKPQKTRLLDEAERVTGYQRKALIRLFHRRPALAGPAPPAYLRGLARGPAGGGASRSGRPLRRDARRLLPPYPRGRRCRHRLDRV